jgi:ribosome maturation factor RimP
MILEELIWEIVYKPIEKMGYKIVRIKKGIDGSQNMQIMAERLKDQMLDINDCVKISKHISVLLEVDKRVEFNFGLEVSSPGINRPLVKIEDFVKFRGYIITTKLKKNLNNQIKFVGKISNVLKDEVIEIESNGEILKVPFDHIDECKLKLD